MKLSLSVLTLTVATTALAQPPYTDSKGRYRPDWFPTVNTPVVTPAATPASSSPTYSLVPRSEPNAIGPAHQYAAPPGWHYNSKLRLVPN